ncbi:MAG: helix-turn-helix domain-containing protein [Bacteroidales bacterium]|nr:helix-turn-helix domain-containing protein [Bacteroidales bacterium]
MRILASPALRPYIKYYWHICGPSNHYAQMIIPNGCARMCFLRKASIMISQNFRESSIKSHKAAPIISGATISNGVIIGAGTRYQVAYLDGEADMIGVELSLLGTYLIRNLGAASLNGTAKAISETGNQKLMELESQIIKATSDYEYFGILNNFFGLLLQQQSKADPNIHRLQQIQTMCDLNFLTDVKQMADIICMSTRQLSRILISQIGISPSDLITLSRYRNSILMIHAHRDWPLWMIAEECGYASLSHMTRDYSKINGHTPGMILSDIKAYTSGPDSSLFLKTEKNGITYMCNLF